MRTLLFLAALFAIVTPLPAQTAAAVRGVVREAGSRRHLEGVVVALLAEDSALQSRTLTDRDGRFVLRAPKPGRYLLRADRIGYQSTFSEWITLAAGRTVEYDLVAEVAPIRLAGLSVTGEGRCHVRPREGLAVARLWGEARKALDAAALTREKGLVRYEVARFERDLDADESFLHRDRIQTGERFADSPFVSEHAEDLARRGYIQTTDRGRLYYAPDTQVLLSDAFLDTHCFAVRRPLARTEGLIALEVRPTRSTSPPDITGVLWIDQSTGRLQTFEFRYTRLRRSFLEDRIGGWAEFERLSTGAWIVRRWVIRMPLIGVESAWFGLKKNERLVGFREVGGEVLGAFTEAGRPLLRTGEAIVEGVVTDSLRGGALPGAVVFASGTGQSAISDSAGRFRLEGLPRGKHLIGFRHPVLDTLGLHPPVYGVRLDEHGHARLELAVPGRKRVVSLVCGDDRTADRGGIIVAVVRDRLANELLSNARVGIKWRGSGALELPKARYGRTGARGLARACGVPSGVRLVVQASYGGRESDSVSVVLEEDDFAKVDLFVPPASDSASAAPHRKSSAPTREPRAAARLAPLESAPRRSSSGRRGDAQGRPYGPGGTHGARGSGAVVKYVADTRFGAVDVRERAGPVGLERDDDAVLDLVRARDAVDPSARHHRGGISRTVSNRPAASSAGR